MIYRAAAIYQTTLDVGRPLVNLLFSLAEISLNFAIKASRFVMNVKYVM